MPKYLPEIRHYLLTSGDTWPSYHDYLFLLLPETSWSSTAIIIVDSGVFLVIVRSSSLVDAPTPLTTDVWIIGSMIRYQKIAPTNRQCTRESRAVNSSFLECVRLWISLFYMYRYGFLFIYFSLIMNTNFNTNLELENNLVNTQIIK